MLNLQSGISSGIFKDDKPHNCNPDCIIFIKDIEWIKGQASNLCSENQNLVSFQLDDP